MFGYQVINVYTLQTIRRFLPVPSFLTCQVEFVLYHFVIELNDKIYKWLKKTLKLLD